MPSRVADHPKDNAKCDFSPENKQKLRPDCTILEIAHYMIDRALKKRNQNGDTNVPTQTNGRPRKLWLIELGYSSDTRYMDKVIEKKEQQTESCERLAVEKYDVMLLPVVLGSAGTILKCLDRAKKTWAFPIPDKRNYTASFT
jgi:hypothetical protein